MDPVENDVAVEIPVSEESTGKTAHTVSTTSANQQITIIIHEHYCKGCEICSLVCPKEVLEMVLAPDRWEGAIAKVANIETCNACMLCEYECPDFAIEVYSVKKEAKKKEK